MNDDSGFLSRWSRRKALVRQGGPAAEELPVDEPAAAAVAAAVVAAPVPMAAPAADASERAEPSPTLDDVSALTHDSSYARFVTPNVDRDVKSAALKKLFTDPHFNVMDGLDTYIDDYGKADPLPASWLAQMTQSRFLGLLTEDEENAERAKEGADRLAAAQPTLPPPCDSPADENPDLRLQPDDAAGRPGPEPGAGEDPGRQP